MQITPNSHQQLGRGQAKLFIVHLLFTYIYWQTIPGHMGIIRNQPGRNQPEKFNTVWRFVCFPGQNLVTFPCSSSRHTLPHPSSTKFFLSFFLSKDTYCPLKASHTAVPFIPPQHFFPHSSPIFSPLGFGCLIVQMNSANKTFQILMFFTQGYLWPSRKQYGIQLMY